MQCATTNPLDPPFNWARRFLGHIQQDVWYVYNIHHKIHKTHGIRECYLYLHLCIEETHIVNKPLQRGCVCFWHPPRPASICQFARDHRYKSSSKLTYPTIGKENRLKSVLGRGILGISPQPPIVEPPWHVRFPHHSHIWRDSEMGVVWGWCQHGWRSHIGVPEISLKDMLPSLKLTYPLKIGRHPKKTLHFQVPCFRELNFSTH